MMVNNNAVVIARITTIILNLVLILLATLTLLVKEPNYFLSFALILCSVLDLIEICLYWKNS
jgi:hypothetical protein